MNGDNRLDGLHLLGATVATASATDLRSFFLTSIPGDDEGLAALYQGYLRSFDNLVESVQSVWHPISSNLVRATLRGIRAATVEGWQSGVRDQQIAAVQMLAGVFGYFNARYRNLDGSIDWSTIGNQVDAEFTSSMAQAAVDAGKMTKQAAQALINTANRVAEEGWGILKTVVYGGLAVVGLAAATAGGIYVYNSTGSRRR